MVIQQFLRETIMSAVFLTIQLVILLRKYYNNWLVLCFGYLISQSEDFKKFISVLSNLYLLLKNSSLKQAVFRHQEWKAYDLLSFTLIKETRAQSKKLGQRPIFLLKRDATDFTKPYSYSLLKVLQQNNALYSFHKRRKDMKPVQCFCLD